MLTATLIDHVFRFCDAKLDIIFILCKFFEDFFENGAKWGCMGLSGDGDRGRRTTHPGRREGGRGEKGVHVVETGSAGGEGDVALG